MEGGGLSSLLTLFENSGGNMTTEAIPRFRLTVNIPKEDNNREK